MYKIEIRHHNLWHWDVCRSYVKKKPVTFVVDADDDVVTFVIERNQLHVLWHLWRTSSWKGINLAESRYWYLWKQKKLFLHHFLLVRHTPECVITARDSDLNHLWSKNNNYWQITQAGITREQLCVCHRTWYWPAVHVPKSRSPTGCQRSWLSTRPISTILDHWENQGEWIRLLQSLQVGVNRWFELLISHCRKNQFLIIRIFYVTLMRQNNHLIGSIKILLWSYVLLIHGNIILKYLNTRIIGGNHAVHHVMRGLHFVNILVVSTNSND